MNDFGQVPIFYDLFQEEVDPTEEVCLLFWFFHNISRLEILDNIVNKLPGVFC